MVDLDGRRTWHSFRPPAASARVDIIIDTAKSSREAGGDPGPIPLQLYATGQIEIRAEDTLIKLRSNVSRIND